MIFILNHDFSVPKINKISTQLNKEGKEFSQENEITELTHKRRSKRISQRQKITQKVSSKPKISTKLKRRTKTNNLETEKSTKNRRFL